MVFCLFFWLPLCFVAVEVCECERPSLCVGARVRERYDGQEDQDEAAAAKRCQGKQEARKQASKGAPTSTPPPHTSTPKRRHKQEACTTLGKQARAFLVNAVSVHVNGLGACAAALHSTAGFSARHAAYPRVVSVAAPESQTKKCTSCLIPFRERAFLPCQLLTKQRKDVTRTAFFRRTA